MLGKAAKVLRIAACYHLGLPYYSRLFLNLTSRCNSKCVYCEAPGMDATGDMSDEQLYRLIDEAAALGVRKCYLGGGEPTLHSEFWNILSYLRGKRIRYTGVFTNGLTLSRYGKEQWAHLDRTVDTLQISLDSADPDVHDCHRGAPGLWRRTVDGIKAATTHLQTSQVVLMTVVTQKNVGALCDLLDFGRQLGVAEMNFLPLNTETNYPGIEGSDKGFLAPEHDAMHETIRAMRDAYAHAGKIAMASNLGTVSEWIEHYFASKHAPDGFWFDKAIPRFACVEPFTSITVNAKGDLLPCALLPAYGDTRSGTLKENLRKANALKRRIRKGKFPGACRACFCMAAANFQYSTILYPLANLRPLARLITRRLRGR